MSDGVLGGETGTYSGELVIAITRVWGAKQPLRVPHNPTRFDMTCINLLIQQISISYHSRGTTCTIKHTVTFPNMPSHVVAQTHTRRLYAYEHT